MARYEGDIRPWWTWSGRAQNPEEEEELKGVFLVKEDLRLHVLRGREHARVHATGHTHTHRFMHTWVDTAWAHTDYNSSVTVTMSASVCVREVKEYFNINLLL